MMLTPTSQGENVYPLAVRRLVVPSFIVDVSPLWKRK
jgi:hypothetical protein